MSEIDNDPFSLDPARMDEHWLEQSRLFRAAAKCWAEAKEDHERAKAAKKVMESRLKEAAARASLDVRRCPEKYGVEPVRGHPTEDGVKQAVLLTKEYKDAEQGVFDAESEVITTGKKMDLADIDKEAFSHRLKTLENFVRMVGMEYWQPTGDCPKEFGREIEALKMAARKRGGR